MKGHGAAAFVLVLCGGCHLVFALDPPDPEVPGTIDASADAAQPLTCPGGYEEWIVGSRSRYRMELVKRPFAGARDACAIDGTHLATVETVLEARELDNRRQLISPATPRVYVGAIQAATATAANEGWTYITGEEVPMVVWAQGEPDDGGSTGDDGGVHNYGSIGEVDAGYLYDIAGGSYYEAVCECDGRPDPIAQTFR